MASDPVLLCTPPLPGLGPVSSSINVLTRSQCWAPHSPRKHGELGLRDTHADRMSGHVPVQLGKKGQVGDPDRGQSHTDDPHCCSQTPGPVGSRFHWFRALMGTIHSDFGPFCKGRKLYAMQHHQGAPGGLTCRALKCQLHVVFGQGLPSVSESPGARGTSPGLLGPSGRHT